MAHSSLLGPDTAPQLPAGRDNAALGPGDSSDSGSDRTGLPVNADSDAAGTGEQLGVDGDEQEAGDITVDRSFTPGRRRGAQADAGERVHDDEDADLDFVDAAMAPEDEEDADADPDGVGDAVPALTSHMQDEGDDTPGGVEPRGPSPGQPHPDPDRRELPDHDDEGAGPPATGRL